ncbi:iron-sulfur cluster repair di-iron protein [Rhodothermus profundi]|uniref:Regulator of cell morphogenesis and NO signaling n=1 Tax=Rhodothermus profundi TaxID=633813 RepID=A0A1M6UIM0_9BACT|nr:iron-sulfur cluster repair di-iron protein [Rhodothermus profundi]SHK69027.1 regulator of cell morphogenesis and NO signaling [Rhodothermus profundi]
MHPWIHQTLGELVAADERRARLFDQLGLDYCCGGSRTLEEACRARGLDPATVAAVLEALGTTEAVSEPVIDWRTQPLSNLIDHIVATHHAYLRRELPRLSALLKRVVAVHGDRNPWLREGQEVFERLKSALEAHMHCEEEMIFSRIRALEQGSTEAGLELEPLLQQAEQEHDAAGEALHRLKELSNNYQPPEGACHSFRALLAGLRALASDMHRHVHRENNILFPRARRLLAEAAA